MLYLESSDIMRLRNLKDKDILLENCSYLINIKDLEFFNAVLIFQN